MNLLNEELNNIKYLFGYKPGRVISEQESVPAEIKRRIPQITEVFDDLLDSFDSPDNNPSDFSDEMEYVSAFVSEVLDRLISETGDPYYEENGDDVKEFIEMKYGDFLFDRYYSDNSNNEDDDEDVDF
jgi:hypothetical protein